VPVAQANGIEIAYERFGDPADPALILIMGLGCQMVIWEVELCEMFAERGFNVIRFDNRDVGLSSKIEGGPEPNLLSALMGDTSSASYFLADMAADTAGLLEALEIDAAHVVGASMGGMIAQQLAIDFPERVLSLTSWMSTTGDRSVGQPQTAALGAITGEAPNDRESYIQFQSNVFKAIGSPKYPMDEQRFRKLAGEQYDRCYYPQGFLRQGLAILASPDRTPGLRQLSVPTLVIHGEDDPLVTVSGGEATAAAIPGARLMKVPGMGHDLPTELFPEFVDAIVENAERAKTEAGARE
jgi:pimeloyl-ACP methyl ester carboxylesterase